MCCVLCVLCVCCVYCVCVLCVLCVLCEQAKANDSQYLKRDDVEISSCMYGMYMCVVGKK